MKERKQLIAVLLIGALVLSIFSGTGAVAKKKKKPKLNKTKITMQVWDDAYLKIKNSGDKKIKWSSSNKKVVSIAVIDRTKRDCWLTGEKAGTAVITAKVGKIKLKCKVKVKAQPKTPKNSTVNRPTVTETPVPTASPTPTVEPTETPKAITIANNFQTLKEYIQTYGFTNSSGNKVISYTDANTERTVQSGIVYDSLNQQFLFICTFESTSGDMSIDMAISENDITHGNFTFAAVVSLSGGTGYATHDLNTLNKESTLNWAIDVTDYRLYSSMKNLADVMYQLGYASWHLLLLEKCGLSMSDLGFDGGYTG